MISLILPKRELRQVKQIAQGHTASKWWGRPSFCLPDTLYCFPPEITPSLARILFAALPGPGCQECDPVQQQPLRVKALGAGPEVEQIEQQERQLLFSGSLPFSPTAPSLSQASEQRAQNPVSQAHG